MAPLAASDEVSNLELSSHMLLARSASPNELPGPVPIDLRKRGLTLKRAPAETYHRLVARDSGPVIKPNHGGGVDPTDINMKGIQALFALIGVAFALGVIWFFFWAKNGGFKWRKGDWDDYKSTVLRRKGPNGTTLSNATKSTKLGGGSVVGEGYSDGTGSVFGGTIMTETMTDLSSEAPIMKEKRAKRETTKARIIRESREAHFEGGNDQDVLAYIREKPARVGGINRDSDALHYGTDYTDTEGSAVNSHRPSRNQGVRGPSRQASPEKRQSRRDFSYSNDDAFSTVSGAHSEIPAPPLAQPHYPEMPAPVQFEDMPPPTPPHRPGRYHSQSPSKQFNQDTNRRSNQYQRSRGPGSYHEPSVISSVSSEIQNQNTKSYHHPLPSLSSQVSSHNPNQSRGYRRDRRDSLD